MRDERTRMHPRPPWRPFDGCHNVFVDVGANRGEHIEAMFNESFAPGPVVRAMDTVFGLVPARRRTGCAVGIEPNPNQEHHLRNIERRHIANGWRTLVLTRTAARDRTAHSVPFYIDNQSRISRHHHEWGSSLFSYQTIQTKKGYVPQVRVRSIDLAYWLKNQVLQRTLASQPKSAIILKMDVEGAEFELLPRLLSTGVLCAMDHVFVEFHDERVGGFAPLLQKIGAPTNFRVNFEYFLRAAQRTPGCKVVLNNISPSAKDS